MDSETTETSARPTPSHPLLDRLWEGYVRDVPYAAAFVELWHRQHGAPFSNDHVALRSLRRDGSGIAMFARVFESLGWKRAGSYAFPDVHLEAIHLSRPGFPRVFVSELDPRRFPADVCAALLRLPPDPPPPLSDGQQELARWFCAPPPPSAADLELVGQATQYGAWLLAFGRKVNHFTAAVADVDAWQRRLLAAGVPMKADIEGNPGDPLRQTATHAALLDVPLADGAVRALPYAYLEIAERRAGFDGFLAPQARQLFDMTAPPSSLPHVRKRRHERKLALLVAELRFGDAPAIQTQVATENVSLGGVFLRIATGPLPAVHQRVELSLELPLAFGGAVEIGGEVVFQSHGTAGGVRGIGVELAWPREAAAEHPGRARWARYLQTL